MIISHENNASLGCMDHSCCVQNGCRVCGGRLSRYRVSYECQSAANQVKLLSIGVTVTQDRKDIHPQQFCHGCYSVCTKKVKANEQGKDYTPRLTKFKWGEHSEISCEVCEKFGKPSRKPKAAPVGRPSDSTLELIAHIKEVAPQSLTLDGETREELAHHPSIDEDLKCLMCHHILDRPLQLTTCNTLICMSCCVEHVYKKTDLSCPCGAAHSINTDTVIPAPSVVLTFLRSTAVPCGRCEKAVRAGTYSIVMKNYNYDYTTLLSTS